MRKRKLLLISFVLLFTLTGAGIYNNEQNNVETSKPIREITTETPTSKPEPREIIDVSEVEPMVERTLSTMYVSAKRGLNIRAFATTESEIIDTVSLNTEIQVYDDFELENWYMISYDNKDCYVNKTYVSKEKTVIPKVQIQSHSNPESQINLNNESSAENATSTSIYSASQFRSMGVINWNGWRWTWYSQNVLPGGGLDIPGRHVDSSGFVCDGDGYICLAASSLSKGSVVSTPFGRDGKVYDSGCAAGTLDVYTNF